MPAWQQASTYIARSFVLLLCRLVLVEQRPNGADACWGCWQQCGRVCTCSCFCPDKTKVVFYLKPIYFRIIWCIHSLQVLMSLLSHIIRQQETHQNAFDNTKLSSFFFCSRRTFSNVSGSRSFWVNAVWWQLQQCQLCPANAWSAAMTPGCSVQFSDVCLPHGAHSRGNALLVGLCELSSVYLPYRCEKQGLEAGSRAVERLIDLKVPLYVLQVWFRCFLE